MQSILPRKHDAQLGYSANVHIELRTNAGVVRPAQTTPHNLHFREPITVAPGVATLIVTVDDEIHESQLEILPHESPTLRVPVRILKTSTLR